MLKRIGTLLLGLGLVGLGVLLFLAPEQAYVVQVLTRYWPLFLVLAGLVRVAGYLIDHHPRSPVGGLLITALGGILLSANLRGEHSFLLLLGRYWFWLLLALVIGRVLRQYTHRLADGARPQAFSPGGIALMLLIVGSGLGANLLARNNQLLARFDQSVNQLGNVGDYVFGNQINIEDSPAQTFTLPANARLVVNNLRGEVEIQAGAGPQASARLIKRIRAMSEDQARQTAKNIQLQVSTNGGVCELGVAAANASEDYSAKLIIAVPASAPVSVEISNTLGAVKLTDLRGDHVIRDCDQVTISNNKGQVKIENPRGGVQLSRIQGDVTLANLRREGVLREITGKLRLAAQGGSLRVEQINGAVAVSAANARLELRGISSTQPLGPNDRLVSLEDISDSRVVLQDITGSTFVAATRSRIDADAITGPLTLNSSAERVRVTRLNGALRLNAENGTVEVEELKGSAEIEASRDVTVRNFYGPLNVTTKVGAINLYASSSLSGDVQATNDHGRIRVTLPENIPFRLDASTNSGRLRAKGFDALEIARNQKAVTANYRGDGAAPRLALRSSSGDIQLQASGLALADNDAPEPPPAPDKREQNARR